MKAWTALTLRAFLTLPIWFYLVYKILLAVDATELMWFLFWVYVPTSLLVASMTDMAVKK